MKGRAIWTIERIICSGRRHLVAEIKIMIRNILNLVMILGILLVMDYRFTDNAIHEILGLFIVLLFIIHNILNRHWYTAIGKGKKNLLRSLTATTNLLLLVMMLLATVTGVFISQTVFPVFSLNSNLWVHQLHSLSSYLEFILSAIHLGFRWKALWTKTCSWLRINGANYSYILLSRIASLLIIGYGMYASFTRHIGSKLLLKHVSNDWATAPSLVGFVLDYLAIMGCYVAITYYLTLMLQKQNHKNIS